MAKKTRKPSFEIENQLLLGGSLKVFGLDEVGRGSFAGPLVAAAVCFDKKYKWFEQIYDSKVLSHAKRSRLSKLIKKHSVHFIEEIDVSTINRVGIEKSNIIAFKKLIQRIDNQINSKKHFLIDGRNKKISYSNVSFYIKGDSKSISIAAASIVAKVYRDSIMRKLGKEFKGYKFYQNKGYGTKFHREAIKKRGLTKIHRTSFNLAQYL